MKSRIQDEQIARTARGAIRAWLSVCLRDRLLCEEFERKFGVDLSSKVIPSHPPFDEDLLRFFSWCLEPLLSAAEAISANDDDKFSLTA